MTKVLIVTAHPLTAEVSRTLQVLDVFKKQYQKNHPDDKIEQLDLFQSNFPEIDADVLAGRNGTDFAKLTETQQRKIGIMRASLEQFLGADKIVIANPMWNQFVPTKLKSWIDSICVAGKTFKYTQTGAVPLLSDSGKKVLHIQATGGKYNGQDAGSQYIKSMLNFMGITDLTKIGVEGMDHFPDEAAQIVKDAKAKAVRVANNF